MLPAIAPVLSLSPEWVTAISAAARRYRDQPQEDAAALSRGRPDRAAAQGAQTRGWLSRTGAGSGVAQSALEPRFRPRSDGDGPPVSGAQRRG